MAQNHRTKGSNDPKVRRRHERRLDEKAAILNPSAAASSSLSSISRFGVVTNNKLSTKAVRKLERQKRHIAADNGNYASDKTADLDQDMSDVQAAAADRSKATALVREALWKVVDEVEATGRTLPSATANGTTLGEPVF
ncbi:BA75_00469T0 [Komagataella pastoris]|uniref:BA75_00469T0 n=1 Tax=Komagataella pastoris TaxID=4922 RepID=A0A1B2J9W7_PICPA|nr:BA75_00469T0 [Komagataella pastoris]